MRPINFNPAEDPGQLCETYTFYSPEMPSFKKKKKKNPHQ